MSGIVGIHFLDGRPVDPIDLEKMVQTLAHRGPDGEGMWSAGPIGLGHRMLRTTPQSLEEKLPLINRTGELVLTADARIDNRDEIIAALGLTDGLQGEISDSELILSAYEKWGEDCPQKLLGDFAFAIWDARKQVVFCARDHFGVKPFYYYHSDQIFTFASEIKALLCLPEVPRRLNELRVAEYLVYMFEDKVITFYQDIVRLPPACTLTVSRHGAKVHTYWSLDPTREIRYSSDQEYAEAFREVFASAVRCRLRSAYPIGSMLSGGLDSSSITCMSRVMLARNGGRPLHTFSAIYDDVPVCDERTYINAVVAQEGIEPHYGHPDRLSPLSDWEGTPWHEDEPLTNAQMAVHWVLYEAARKQNVRVLLDGYGGDFVVYLGIAYLTDLARSGRWITFIREAAELGNHFNLPLSMFLWRRAVVALAPQTLRQAVRTLRGRNRSTWTFQTPIRPDFAKRVDLVKRVASLQGEWSKPIRTCRREQWLCLTSGLHPFSLEVMDRVAALFHIEPRYAFLDRRLMEFCLALPPEQKLHKGWTRIVMRRALANILPEEVRWRGGKADLGPGFNHGLLTHGREVLEDLVLNEPGCIREYVNLNTVRKLYQQYVLRCRLSDGFDLWQVATLELWLRRTGFKPCRWVTNSGKLRR